MKSFLLRVCVSLFFIGLLFYLMRDDIPQVVNILKNARHLLMLGATLVFLSSAFVLARRLQIIFHAEDIPLGFLHACNLTFIGYFFNNFLPTSVGGDIVKAMCASRITGQTVKSVTTVLMDRIFGLFTFILIPSFSLLFFMKQIGNPIVPIITYSLLFVSIFCFFLIFSRNLARRFRFFEDILRYFHLAEKAKRIYEGLHDFRNRKGVVCNAMLLSIVGQSIAIVVLYWMSVALGAHVNPIYFFLLVPVVHLVSMLPSLNGLGIREGAYIYFLSPIIGRECAAGISILWLGLLFLMSFIGGIIYLIRHDYHIRFKEAAASSA